VDECRSGPTYDDRCRRSLELGKSVSGNIVRPDLPPSGDVQIHLRDPPADARDREGHHLRAEGCGTVVPMCRSIKTLRRPDETATEEEIRAAALQFVRKVSGYRAPSRKNEVAFNAAVDEVASASRRLLDRVSTG